MAQIIEAVRANRVLWLLIFVPVLLVVNAAAPHADTLLFLLSIIAILPLAALLNLATENVAERTGDAVGGLLNATLGNLTEMIIALAALGAGEYVLVKASMAGAIVTKTLFMMGASFLIGGVRHHVQEFNAQSARIQVSMLFLASFALLAPSAVAQAGSTSISQGLSLGIALLLIGTYALGLYFTLGSHREIFSQTAQHEAIKHPWSMPSALVVLGVTTVFVALVSEVFVGSVTGAAEQLSFSPAFVGFVVVALVGGVAEMTSALSAAAKNRLDMSVGIAFGSAAQIALFVTPMLVVMSYFLGPVPMDLQFTSGTVVMMFIATSTAALVTHAGRSAWFVGFLMLMVYLVFAMTLFMMPAAA